MYKHPFLPLRLKGTKENLILCFVNVHEAKMLFYKKALMNFLAS
jgi:hypothetical protein